MTERQYATALLANCPECGADIRTDPDPTVFDPHRNVVLVENERRHFTRMEWEIITLLRSRLGLTVNRGFVWQYIYSNRIDPPEIKIVDVYICYIRRKLRGTPYRIITVRGIGWMLSRRATP